MLYKELNFINQCYIQDPDSTVPLEWCYRDEIANPHRLHQVAAAAAATPGALEDGAEWLDMELNDVTYKQRCFPLGERITGVPLRLIGFHVVLQDEGLEAFATVLAAGTTRRGMKDWLRRHGATQFAITTPILEHDIDERLYIQPNVPQAAPIPTSLFSPTLREQLEGRCYTIGNGLTLAIAMSRLGLWAKEIFAPLIGPYLAGNHAVWPPTIVGSPFFSLFLMTPIPHICDHPYFYARMGRNAAPRRVARALEQTQGPHIVQLVTPFTTYLANADSVGWPYQRHHDGIDQSGWLVADPVDDLTPGEDSLEFDLPGYLLWHAGVRKLHTRSFPSWATILDTMIRNHRCSHYEVLDRILLPCFHFYQHGYHGLSVSRRRLQLIWKTINRLLPVSVIHHWVQRVLILCTIYRFNPRSRYYPQVPFPYFQDVVQGLRINIFEKERIRLYSYSPLTTFALFSPYLVRSPTPAGAPPAPLLPSAAVTAPLEPPEPPEGLEDPPATAATAAGATSMMTYNHGTGLYCITMVITMYQLLRVYARSRRDGSTIGHFFRYLEKRMVSRLHGLAHYCEKNHLVDMLVRYHLQEPGNRMKLVI